MPAELGGSQISSLLEALPGIASVLRSPVADALVKAIRAAVGLGEFEAEDAEELIRYAVRRGLIGPDEGDRVLAEVQEAVKVKRKAVRGGAAAKPRGGARKTEKKKKRR
jgi:Arc/MetJ-type ribon-helix-helix transcriptional regulator